MKISRLARAKFKVKIKSLAEEARIIRSEERKMVMRLPEAVEVDANLSYDLATTESARGQLRHHRISVVRNEQRSTLLAYALCRGVPYHVVERKARPVDMKAVARIAQSLAWYNCEQSVVAFWIAKSEPAKA